MNLNILIRVALVCAFFGGVFAPGAHSEEIRVAVASNFAQPMKTIAKRFEDQTSHSVSVAVGSTGKHYAQIKNGAPFAAFFAADRKRPRLLEEQGVAVPGSRFTYAVGKLVLWSTDADYVDSQGKVLQTGDYDHVALANPKLAPYGSAARQVVRKKGLWKKLEGKRVRGENVAQTYQFVRTGHAKLGFVAYSQIKHPDSPAAGSFWEIPQSFYDPIEQQAVLIEKSEAAQAFLSFCKNKEAAQLIKEFGYERP